MIVLQVCASIIQPRYNRNIVKSGVKQLLHLDSDSGKSMHETHKFEEPVKVPDHDLGKILYFSK
jgi:hypothetical protein